MDDIFGPVIDAHTREDAIADGDLIPVPKAAASAADVWWKVALTRAAWARVGDEYLAELMLGIRAARNRRETAVSTPAGEFALTFEADGEQHLCMTVSLPDED